jgi:hypothetical protein
MLQTHDLLHQLEAAVDMGCRNLAVIQTRLEEGVIVIAALSRHVEGLGDGEEENAPEQAVRMKVAASSQLKREVEKGGVGLWRGKDRVVVAYCSLASKERRRVRS